jgi:Xaa-Pro aminopeptidase
MGKMLFRLVMCCWTITLAATMYAADVLPAEFKARRAELMAHLPDGIVLLHARGDVWISQNAWYQYSQHEDPSFYYFSGSGPNGSAILAVDGISKETWLFRSTKALWMIWMTRPPNYAAMATELGINHIAAWEEFVPWLEQRLASKQVPILYVDDTDSWWSLRRFGRAIPESNPPGLDPIEDYKLLWRRSLERRWPGATVKSGSPVIQEMRLVKSPAEIELMRAAGRASVDAWRRGAVAIAHGDNSRQVEAEVIRGCVDSGAQGPAHWPEVGWSLAGGGYYHPTQLPAGKLIALDIGCDVDRYHTDISRMVPVSGRFTPEQKEMWEVFVAIYRAGLAAIRDGARRSDVFEAAAREADRLKRSLQNPSARKVAEAMAGQKEGLLHSMGLQCCEGEPEILRAGMIVCFEPGIFVNGESFSIEDETLVKKEGYEVLAPLPYEAAEIEQVMRPVRR